MEEATFSPAINHSYKFKSPRKKGDYMKRDPKKYLTFNERIKTLRNRYPQDFNLLDDQCTFSPSINGKR